ncbi:MAG: LOG family protein [Anaerolineae bacterium]|nr:LOG family protein [Anaerolineae bacterium]
MPVIAIFGGGLIQPEEPNYIAAYEIGKHLGAAGYAIMTGGYKGVMEAASRGAAEAGASVVGVTSAPIELIRRVKPNLWVDKVVPYDNLRERLLHLVMQADGYVVMPGGIGTLPELLLVWELIRVRELPPRPLVCYSPYWEEMLAPFRANPHVPAANWDFLSFAYTPAEVVENIRKGL